MSSEDKKILQKGMLPIRIIAVAYTIFSLFVAVNFVRTGLRSGDIAVLFRGCVLPCAVLWFLALRRTVFWSEEKQNAYVQKQHEKEQQRAKNKEKKEAEIAATKEEKEARKEERRNRNRRQNMSPDAYEPAAPAGENIQSPSSNPVADAAATYTIGKAGSDKLREDYKKRRTKFYFGDNCATCEFWNGERTPAKHNYYKGAECPNMHTTGHCTCSYAKYSRRSMSAGSYRCDSYERWKNA